WPEVAVVAHTAYADETYVREMVAAGARGDVLKGDVTAAVLEALSAARQGPGPAVGRGHRAGHGGPAPAVRGRGQPLQGAGGRERRPERLGGPAGRRPPQGRVPGHGQPRAADPDHGRPGHGPDPGRAARHGRHRRRPGDSAAGRLPGQTSARHGRAAAPGQRVRGQPQPGAAGRGGHGRRGGGRGGRRLAAGRARPPRRAAPARPAPLPPRATPRPCGWWSATWSTTPASTLRPAPPSSHGRPARGPDPDPGHRRRRGGGRDRPGAHLRSLHPARRLHHPAGGWGRPRPVPGRSAGQGHGGQGLGGRTPPAAGPVSWSSCPTWPRYRIAPPAPGTAGAVEASKPV
ncbi:MAG: hypothetical protein K0S88_3935, partial [Actinomycetia bacterium]|nr:hypothetical protein [Actinomycetes bacterium]